MFGSRQKLLREQRAQTSVELVVLTGVVIVIAFSLFPTILREVELDRALAAARDGAEFAVSMRGMGYDSPTGKINIPPGAIKIKNLELVDKGMKGTKTKYLIRVYAVAPSYIASNSTYTNSIGNNIRQYSRGYIYKVFHGSFDPSLNDVETDRFIFSIGYSIAAY